MRKRCDDFELWFGKLVDVDAVAASVREGQAVTLRALIEQLQQCLTALEAGRPKPLDVEKLSAHWTKLLTVSARLETLDAIKRQMMGRESKRAEQVRAEMKRMLEAWPDYDDPYNRYAASTTIVRLKEERLLKWLRLTKKGQNVVRYTFTRTPADHPIQYRCFRKVAAFFEAWLAPNATEFVADWDAPRPEPIRSVARKKDEAE